MLTYKTIEDIVVKLGIDYNVANAKSDEDGDFVSAFDPDFSIDDFKSAVQANVVWRKKIVDQGVMYQELQDTLWVDGNQCQVTILAESGMGNFGTTIKVLVRRINAMVGSEMKSFTGFAALNRYLNLTVK